MRPREVINRAMVKASLDFTRGSFYATIWGVVLLDVVDMTLVKLCRLLFGNAPLLIVAAFRIIGIPH